MTESHQHITCQELVELVTDYLEGSMDPDQVTLFEQHLNFCDGCVWYVDQFQQTVETVGRIEEEDLSPESREKLLTAFRDWKGSPS